MDNQILPRPNALGALIEELKRYDLLTGQRHTGRDIPIRGITHDSRAVMPGYVFCALRGVAADGHLFIDKAVENGASAVVCETIPETALASTAWIEVEDSRKAVSVLAAAAVGHPAESMRLIGVTGTNGKTTVSTFVHQMLQALGEKAGLIGTVTCMIGNRAVDVPLTTPDPIALHGLFREMRDEGCTSVAMEVSSHALHQDRVYGIPFAIAAFTNLTRDHLDYHGSEEAYLKSKKILFDELGSDAAAIVNAEDPAWKALVADTSAAVRTYGFTSEADIRVEILRNDPAGLHLRLDGHEGRFRQLGHYNALNLGAAYAIGRALGHPPEQIIEALAEAPGAPGRFERIILGGELMAVVDYAHTPDALRNILQAINDVKPVGADTWVVFGCGGDRDRGKRPMMGEATEANADHVIVTSDNPRTEVPEAILDDIRTGMTNPDDATWIVSRQGAIRHAVTHAAKGDIILVSGKGNEKYQEIGTKRLPFDDVTEIREAYELRTNA